MEGLLNRSLEGAVVGWIKYGLVWVCTAALQLHADEKHELAVLVDLHCKAARVRVQLLDLLPEPFTGLFDNESCFSASSPTVFEVGVERSIWRGADRRVKYLECFA